MWGWDLSHVFHLFFFLSIALICAVLDCFLRIQITHVHSVSILIMVCVVVVVSLSVAVVACSSASLGAVEVPVVGRVGEGPAWIQLDATRKSYTLPTRKSSPGTSCLACDFLR